MLKKGPSWGEVVVAGDSYGKNFFNDEQKREIKFREYCNNGLTIDENYKTLIEAFDSFSNIVLFSISVNDQQKGTHPVIFEIKFREMLDKARETEKIVIVHTYMHYPYANFANAKLFPFSTYEYDSVVRKLANEYDNVFYIDMNDYGGVEYMTEDGIHYNKEFNDALYDRLKVIIDNLQ